MALKLSDLYPPSFGWSLEEKFDAFLDADEQLSTLNNTVDEEEDPVDAVYTQDLASEGSVRAK